MLARLLDRCLLPAVCCLLTCAPLLAEDRDAAFLNALRARGEGELALEYLKLAEQDPTISDAFRARMPYERSLATLEQLRSEGDAARRQSQRDEVRTLLAGLGADAKNGPLVAEGWSKLATSFADEGRRLLAEAAQAPAVGDRRDSLRGDARKALDEARELFTQAETSFTQVLEKYRSVAADSAEGEARLRLRGLLANARLLRGIAGFELARTHAHGTPDHKTANKTAATELAAVHEKYSDWLVGLLAHYYEGRCYEAAGDDQLAIGCFESLVELPTTAGDFRKLVTMAQARRTAIEAARKKYDQAIPPARKWLGQLSSTESASAEAAGLQYELAVALLAAEPKPERRTLSEARELLRSSTAVAHEQLTEAQQKLAEVSQQLGRSEGGPANFAEALQAGRTALGAASAARVAVDAAKHNNPDAVAHLQQQAADSSAQALENLEAALALMEDETPAADRCEVRYLLAWLAWNEERLPEAATLATFVATRHPDTPNAEGSAKLALAAWDRLAREAGSDGEFERSQLTELAQFVTRRWAGSALAESAFGVLLGEALRTGDLAAARAAIAQVAPTERPAFELRLACSQWEEVNRRAAAGAKPAELLTDRGAAAKLLADSFAKVRGQTPFTSAAATGALYLAQAQIDDDRSGDAIALLSDQQIGLLNLIKSKDPAVDRPGFAPEAYKTALRAYVSADPPLTDEALATMNLLEKSLPKEEADKLNRIYLGLGLQVQRQIAGYVAAGKNPQAERLATALGEFVKRLGERRETADWNTQLWIGQMYLNLGDGLAAGSDRKRSQAYFRQASEVFSSLLGRAEKEPGFAPQPNSVLAARLQLGQSQRKQGAYAEAIASFAALLAEREVMLDVQQAAADTYRDWGAAEPDRFTSAIAGGEPAATTGKNLIWGYRKLASVAAQASRKRPELQELFFASWLNIARTRYLAAMSASGAERTEQLDQATNTIRAMHRQYPDLGGKERHAEFDALLKDIQRAKEEEPEGFAAWEDRST
jgi:hypothetical protein